MSKQLYLEVVKGSSSEEELKMSKTSKSGSIVNWLHEYQTDEEDVALEKALNLMQGSLLNNLYFVLAV